MRFPKKREWSALVALYTRGERMNLGEALDLLRSELCVTKRTAMNILKRLKRLGLVSFEASGGAIEVIVADPSEALRRMAEAYSRLRREKCRLRGSGQS